MVGLSSPKSLSQFFYQHLSRILEWGLLPLKLLQKIEAARSAVSLHNGKQNGLLQRGAVKGWKEVIVDIKKSIEFLKQGYNVRKKIKHYEVMKSGAIKKIKEFCVMQRVSEQKVSGVDAIAVSIPKNKKDAVVVSIESMQAAKTCKFKKVEPWTCEKRLLGEKSWMLMKRMQS